MAIAIDLGGEALPTTMLLLNDVIFGTPFVVFKLDPYLLRKGSVKLPGDELRMDASE